MQDNKILFDITLLVINFSIIIMASFVAQGIARKSKIPTIVIFLIMGIILGPFLLGAIPIGSLFPHGLFPKMEGAIPVSPYLYSLSALASMILLFMAGLETDMALFLKFAVAGSIVGISEFLITFLSSYLISLAFLHYSPFHPIHLFMATVASATSVGISSSLLSSQQKTNSPEGVTILSAAVLDDVLGIVALAIIVGLGETLQTKTSFDAHLWIVIGITTAKAIGIWLICTVLGIVFSRKIGKGIKTIFKDATNIAIFSLALAFLLGGVFELVGLSMVIGAYIVGLALSNTDVSFVIQEKITLLLTLFVPLFFIVTGMLINIEGILQWDTLLFGLTYALVAILAKIIGAGIPSLLLGFNPLGALRIGLGMVPRGEVSLIIAGIGLGLGIMDDKTFGAVLIMIFITTIITPFFLNKALANKNQGMKKPLEEQVSSTFDFKDSILRRLIVSNILQLLDNEDYFINKTSRHSRTTYHIRKDSTFLSLIIDEDEFPHTLIVHSDSKSITFVNTAIYEASANLAESAQQIKESLDTKHILAQSPHTEERTNIDLSQFMSTSLVTLQIESNTKEGIIEELIDMLDQEDLLLDRETFTNEVLKRERTLSTGLQHGVAIPHAKTKSVTQASLVIGLKPEGVDFDSLDGEPSKIFLLIASTGDAPHLEILTSINMLLQSEEFREKVLKVSKKATLVQLFSQ